MLRLSNFADYAVIMLVHVVMSNRDNAKNDWFSASMVASELSFSVPTVTKIIGLLAKAGLLTTQRGAHGGFRLSFAPASISIAAVVEAVDGPIALTHCTDHGADALPCDRLQMCTVSNHWQIINRTVRDSLVSLSIADLAKPAPIFDFMPSQASEVSHGRN